MSHINIEGRDDIVRDPNSGAVLSTNRQALNAYKARQNQTSHVENEINTLKSEMQDIKNLLMNLVNSTENNQ
tara:strand:- start:1487 stop:1702 length:216 start_codon:yes stop_codon:yes gene_type:complete